MGPPGSGKTTAALLYGQVLSELGFFPNRIVKLVSATSLISKHEDGTTSNTNQLLKETRDGVLILDDLHRIDLGEGQFLGAALLPTLLSSAQSSTIYGGPRGNGCILLVGDADSMEDLYQNAESGLRANYPLETAVKLRDFTSNELKQVLAINIQERKISLSEDAWNIALQTLEKARCRPAFGNGHAVRQLLDESLLRYYKRNAQAERGGDIVYLAGAVPEPPPLQPEDLDPSYNRLDNAHSNFSLLFHGLVDFEPIVTIFQDYAYTASGMKLRGIDPRAYIPFTFVFKGPPGTGKTSSARKLGQIFYDLGFLSSPDVVECSASNLVAKWVGHTGPLVIRQMEKALGRVLFIDEAYRLATTQGHKSFQDEAISELVDAITKPKFARKLVIVLAGYSEEMNALMSSNPGLRSRFATEIRFLPLSPKGCLEYLRKCVGKVGIQLDGLDPLPAPASLSQVEVTMMRLSASKNWASGRSIESIAERIMAKVFKRCAIENDATGPMIVTAEELSTLLDDILKENSGQRRAHTSQAGYHLGDTQYIL
ncbi:P-loop containing nucleoside triphosphate hydrolase protein [Xylaria flabelliformis]|nr:P-loop containing nucleoside triphosphate hydrolase protein [Xylaria flabelliformis]KAI0183394.1 P-loop containing nucleoside triphosphate hydrolase protein [Xylaria flabelliformis]